MRLFWRVLFAALLLGGISLWFQHAVTAAAARIESDQTVVRAPATRDDNDNALGEDNDNNDNNDDNDNHDNDNHDNDNDSNVQVVDNDNDIPTDASQTGLQVQSGDLTIDLWLGMDHAVVNKTMGLAVTGSGAEIDRVYWWAVGPGSGDGNPSSMGVQTHECGGANPCTGSWEITPRSVGLYYVYARVRDTSGREVETVRRVQVASNPWG